jgi:exodeoxyribonuclease VII small subunit
MAAKKNQAPPKNFEDALAELERILGEIEGGEVPLEESLVKYERGQFLIRHCRGVLSAAEKQIEVLGKPPGAADDVLPSEPVEEEEADQ